jgi:hypothetical protein
MLLVHIVICKYFIHIYMLEQYKHKNMSMCAYYYTQSILDILLYTMFIYD